MSIALAALAVLSLVLFFAFRSRGSNSGDGPSTDTTPALDRWIAETLEGELSPRVLAHRAPSDDERRPLTRTLEGSEPDTEIIAKIEAHVKSIDVEYVRFSHEGDAEVTLRVRFEDGTTSTTAKRIPLNEVPVGVRNDFQRLSSTHVFRTWLFPWSRASIL